MKEETRHVDQLIRVAAEGLVPQPRSQFSMTMTALKVTSVLHLKNDK